MNDRVEHPPNHRKRNFWLILLAAIFLILGLAWFFFWLFIGRFYVYTDDAYVAGNQVVLAPQITSGVVAIYADNTDLVEEGQLIVQLDRNDFEITYNAKRASLAETVRVVAQLFESVNEKKAEVQLRNAELNQKKLDLYNRENLNGTGAISKEEFEQTQTNVSVASAALKLAEAQLTSARLLVENTTINTHPLVKEAVSQLKRAYLDLIRCQIWSPVTGFIAKRIVQVGDQAIKGQTLLWIVPLDYLWVDANYKETQLKHVRVNQPVSFTADIYGREIKYHGKVIGFSAGSGSAFALLPPQNASGNWIKIVQRVPVRISIDLDELKQYPLLIGLSMHMYIDIHDQSGPKLTNVPTEKPIYTTPIYDRQFQELEELNITIDEIITMNGPCHE